MSLILHIARREWREQRRQPVMLAVIGTLYSLVAGLVLIALLLLRAVADNSPQVISDIMGQSVDPDQFFATATLGILNAYSFLMFSQFLGIAAVMSGHAVLHDRQCGTLTFLLLAPVRRTELLIGKVLGAIGPAMVLYLICSGGGALLAAGLSFPPEHYAYLPTNPAWWIAFLLGGPVWAMFVGTVCTTVSSLANDVRTAQQGVWFVVFFTTLFCGYILTTSLPMGIVAELLVAGAGAIALCIMTAIGSSIMSRDIRR